MQFQQFGEIEPCEAIAEKHGVENIDPLRGISAGEYYSAVLKDYL
jgi:hypothetical protein